MLRKARLLEAACKLIAQLRKAGATMVKARGIAIRRYHGRRITCGRRLTLSIPTIERWYYAWEKCPSFENFLPNVCGPLVNEAETYTIVAHAITNDGLPLRCAYMELKQFGYPLTSTYETHRRHAIRLDLLELVDRARAIARLRARLEAEHASDLRALESKLSRVAIAFDGKAKGLARV